MVYDGDETSSIRLGMRVITGSHRKLLRRRQLARPSACKTGSRSPGLFALRLGYNDETTDVPVATYKTNMLCIISTFRSVDPRKPVLLIAFPDRGLTGRAAPWSAYVNAMKGIVDADRAALLLDLRTWAPGRLDRESTTDNVHPNDAGQVIVENGLASLAYAR
ncbi:lysophospholipase L1-like esterase [Microbacterium sp. SORGH_AS 505]|uniref:SGNH/GDSL hydrolase family protein n=1 Tax=Microbacterium sp. SORGH_AS_0505 TaxID=3041770 RepID=UPI002780534F|nr:SGNH/GDSL hydrolase family protein [Microbacterium sp. SORGH_AS_0505]MDQ1125484.1 lysophospholipase L1-like esterase [Microbacterium sp. SORGH_AS_0505]